MRATFAEILSCAAWPGINRRKSNPQISHTSKAEVSFLIRDMTTNGKKKKEDLPLNNSFHFKSKYGINLRETNTLGKTKQNCFLTV